MPIFLVSACASGEEFISAFRRYADRNGVVFIPIAAPLPPGKKGRFALTLKDGGVMVEGLAEVVSSAKTPSVLYGRVGMTLKFTEPDDPSKTLLGELEKARLQMKPAPPSVAPRPAQLPAEPRATPPAPTGRVDAFNALAECVVIGDLSTLTSDDGPRPGAKFTVPSIPPVAGRPKSPSIPGAATATTMGMPPIKSPTGQTPAVPRPPTPPSAPPITAPPRPPTPAAALPVVGAKETVMGMPALEKAPALSTAPLPVPAPPPPVVAAKETVMGMPALVKAPAERDDPTMPTPAKVAAAAAAGGSRDKLEALQTVRGPAPGVDLVSPGKKIDLNETMRGPGTKMPSATATPPRGTTPPPFVPRQPTPPAPTPVVSAPPAVPTPVVAAPPAAPIVAAPQPVVDTIDDADEPTDLTELPLVPVEQVTAELGSEKSGREPRRTVIGIAVVPSGVHVLPAAPARRIASEEESRDTSVMEVPSDELSGPVMITSTPPKEVVDVDALGATQPAANKLPSAVMSATVEEATPSGDWTMTPGEHGPTIAPRASTPLPVATSPPAQVAKARVQTADPEDGASINQIPAGAPTGDWMIALDPSQPDGWSEPSKVAKRPEGLPPEPGPPVSTVSSAKDLDSDAKTAPEPKLPDAAKVEVDPTLMEPLQPLQPIDDFDDEPQPPPSPSASASMPAMTGLEVAAAGRMHTPLPMPGPVPGSYVTPLPGQVQLASSSAQVPMYSMDPAQLQMGQPRGVTDSGSGFFRDTNEVPRYPTDSSSALADAGAAARKRRLIVIIASAGGALLLVIVLAMVLGGGKNASGDGAPKDSDTAIDHGVTDPTTPPKQPDRVTPPKGDGSNGGGGAQLAVVDPTPPPDAAEAVVSPADAPEQVAAPTECIVEFATFPQGAEIVLDKGVVGTTPAKLTLPCGVESRLTFRKQRFVSAQRAVTPNPAGQKPVRVALAKVTFTVKVSSSPPGATIYLGTKSLGITPAAIKLPAFETSTLKIAKVGYAPDVQKIAPKTNNLSISATLKKQIKKALK